MYLDRILVEFQVMVLDSLVGGLPDDWRDGFMGEAVRDFGIIGGCHFCAASLTVRMAAGWDRGE